MLYPHSGSNERGFDVDAATAVKRERLLFLLPKYPGVGISRASGTASR